jgi:hypothetical protein
MDIRGTSAAIFEGSASVRFAILDGAIGLISRAA